MAPPQMKAHSDTPDTSLAKAPSKVPAKKRLLNSAAILFADKGFAGVSVREICKHAHTSMNMIHHYFGNKEQLLEAIVEQFGDGVFKLPTRLLDKPVNSQAEFLLLLELLFETTLDTYIEHRQVLMVVIREQASPAALPNYMTRFSAFLDEAKKQGHVRAELDSEMVTGFILDRILNQVQFAPWLYKTYGIDLVNDSEYKARWCKSNIDLFIHGILPKN